MAAYFFNKVPYIAVQMAPAAALISVIILISMMKKHNELTAIKASGISIARLSAPLIVSSVVLSVGVFMLSEFLVPRTYSKSRSIFKEDVKKQKQKQFYGHSDIWYKGVDCIYWIKLFDTKKYGHGQPHLFFSWMTGSSLFLRSAADGPCGPEPTGRHWMGWPTPQRRTALSTPERLMKWSSTYLKKPEAFLEDRQRARGNELLGVEAFLPRKSSGKATAPSSIGWT